MPTVEATYRLDCDGPYVTFSYIHSCKIWLSNFCLFLMNEFICGRVHGKPCQNRPVCFTQCKHSTLMCVTLKQSGMARNIFYLYENITSGPSQKCLIMAKSRCRVDQTVLLFMESTVLKTNNGRIPNWYYKVSIAMLSFNSSTDLFTLHWDFSNEHAHASPERMEATSGLSLLFFWECSQCMVIVSYLSIAVIHSHNPLTFYVCCSYKSKTIVEYRYSRAWTLWMCVKFMSIVQ